MAIKFLLDEHLRGPLWWAIQRHNSRSDDQIDAVRVGDGDCPALGSSDSEILSWAEQAKTILITLDEATMPDHLADHLRNGHHSPGVFMLRPAIHLTDLVEFLVLATLVCEPEEWFDRIAYVP